MIMQNYENEIFIWKDVVKLRTMQKLYCYVDETGQDTQGKLFSVCCTIIVRFERLIQFEELILGIERISRKKSKWQKTDKYVKQAFLKTLLAHTPSLKNHIYIQHFFNIKAFTEATTEAISRSIIVSGNQHFPAIVYIDGLPKKLTPTVAVLLRRRGIATEKVKGLKDEQSPLIRLSDAIAGFVRDYLEGEDYTKPYFHALVQAGVVKEI